MLVLRMLFEAFSTTKPENRIFRRYALMVTDRSFDSYRKSSAQGKIVAGLRVPVSVIEKLRAAWAGQAPSGSFDYALCTLCQAIDPRGASLRMTGLSEGWKRHLKQVSAYGTHCLG
jgi:hypothetical protein